MAFRSEMLYSHVFRSFNKICGTITVKTRNISLGSHFHGVTKAVTQETILVTQETLCTNSPL